MCKRCFCCCHKKKNKEDTQRNTVNFPLPTVSSMVHNQNRYIEEDDEIYNGSDISSVSYHTPITRQPLPSIPISTNLIELNQLPSQPMYSDLNVYENPRSLQYENPLDLVEYSNTQPPENPSQEISLTLSRKDSSNLSVLSEDSNKITLKGSVNINGAPQDIFATLEIKKNDLRMSSVSNRESSGYVPMSPGVEDVYSNLGYFMEQAPKVDRSKKPTLEQIKKRKAQKLLNEESMLRRLPRPAPRKEDNIYESIRY